MKATKDQQLEKALELAKTLGLRVTGVLTSAEFYSSISGTNIFEKIVWLEETFGVLVYAWTHEFTSFGECYSFLYVSSYLEDFPHHDIRVGKNGEMVALAWVWTVDREHCSEFGSIVVKNEHGTLVRIG